jgi:rubrerythrin
VAARRKVPPLPKREELTEVWHPRVLDWWRAVWKSPMAGEYLEADRTGGLYLLAELYQRRWTEKDTRILVAITAEIRQQETRFGLSPTDRRKLQWTIEQGETAVERTAARRRSKNLEAVSRRDPRSVIRVLES